VDKNKPQWFVYMLRCADSTLYTGITTDIERRVVEHNSSLLGAKYTRARRPVSLVYQMQLETRALAAKEEYAIKRLSKSKKEVLVSKSV